MDLHKAGIGKTGASLISAPGCRYIGTHGIGGKEVDIAVTAGGKNHGMGSVGFNDPAQHIAGNNAAGLAVNNNDIEHLSAGKHFDLAFFDLAHESGISAQ